jgi:hypothetical protein
VDEPPPVPALPVLPLPALLLLGLPDEPEVEDEALAAGLEVEAALLAGPGALGALVEPALAACWAVLAASCTCSVLFWSAPAAAAVPAAPSVAPRRPPTGSCSTVLADCAVLAAPAATSAGDPVLLSLSLISRPSIVEA